MSPGTPTLPAPEKTPEIRLPAHGMMTNDDIFAAELDVNTVTSMGYGHLGAEK